MSKYQEALDNLVKVSCPKQVSCTECDINKICNCTAKEYVDTLQELIDKATPKKVTVDSGCNSRDDIVSTIEEVFEDEELSAKEMFEELGYVKTNLLKTPSVHYENKKWETAISIFDNEKGRSIHIYALGNTYQDSGFIGVDELKAINQQCKELGWVL